MIISIILLILSFLIEGLASTYIQSSFTSFNLFSTLYTLIALIVIYPYFYNEKKYYILLIIFSSLIDIVYTNTFMLNLFLFIIISFIVKILNFILPENILMVNIMALCSVWLYYVFSYIILTVINYNTYPICRKEERRRNMVLTFKEEKYAWGDTFFSYDENNERKYRVKSGTILLSKKFEIYDLNKNLLVTIKNDPKSLLKKKFEIFIGKKIK